MSTLRAFLRDESGATAIQYALLVAAVVVAIIAVANNLGTLRATRPG
jgi:pilus assembly protein Flp/PilA